MELRGLEPLTPTLPVWCATSCAIAPYSVESHRRLFCFPPARRKLHHLRIEPQIGCSEGCGRSALRAAAVTSGSELGYPVIVLGADDLAVGNHGRGTGAAGSRECFAGRFCIGRSSVHIDA